MVVVKGGDSVVEMTGRRSILGLHIHHKKYERTQGAMIISFTVLASLTWRRNTPRPCDIGSQDGRNT